MGQPFVLVMEKDKFMYFSLVITSHKCGQIARLKVEKASFGDTIREYPPQWTC